MSTRSAPTWSGGPPRASLETYWGGSALLNRHVDEVAPLGPRAVVVLDVGLAEQLVEHEPGVRRALADPAVGDDRLAVGDALGAVELLEVRGGLERAVLLDRLRPRHRRRPGDVPGALRALLLIAGHGDQLAAVLLRRAHIDQLGRAVQRRQHLVALGADRVVAGLRAERRGLIGRHVSRRRAALADPLLARAVDELDVVVPVVLQIPVRVGREPVVAIAIQDDGVLVGDPARAEQLTEGLRAEEVALDLVLEI